MLSVVVGLFYLAMIVAGLYKKRDYMKLVETAPYIVIAVGLFAMVVYAYQSSLNMEERHNYFKSYTVVSLLYVLIIL